MDSVIGIKGRDFVIMATDRYAAYSVLKIKDTEDKIIVLDNNKLMACGGDPGDRLQMGGYLEKNIHLQRIVHHGRCLSTKATAHVIRTEMAEAIRRNPAHLNILLGGLNDEGKAEMYRIDFLGSLVESSKAAHGYASHFVLGLMDREYREDMSYEEALELMKKCCRELETRFLLSQTKFTIKAARSDGIVVCVV